MLAQEKDTPQLDPSGDTLLLQGVTHTLHYNGITQALNFRMHLLICSSHRYFSGALFVILCVSCGYSFEG